MPNEVQTHRIKAEDSARFVLGEYPVHIVTTAESLAALLRDSPESTLIIGTRARLLHELAVRVLRVCTFGFRGATHLQLVEKQLARCGWSMDQAVCALPNLETARYLFSPSDGTAHRFLVETLLLPRQHALPRKQKWMLRIYACILRIHPGIQMLHRSFYTRIAKS